jgi:hypothetical protein
VLEINTWIHKELDLGADLNPGTSPAHLQEGVVSIGVSMFGPISAAYMILYFIVLIALHLVLGCPQRTAGCPSA